eukprot:Phypoly_transcript_13300.p1 GENE.Phypoly_transcript_13300~~Phypoly_transcript_13300.p1  ORF type:complete len:292 (+),score=9.41 Phypoly_transcript_13300:48-923(+)
MGERMNLDHKLDAPLDSLINGHKRRLMKPRTGRTSSGSGSEEPCRDHLRGGCPRGSSCPYSHTAPKEQCQNFLRGACTRGSECPYSHKVPADVCRDYLLRDDCPRGIACPYKHPRKRGDSGHGDSGRRDTGRGGDATQNAEICRDYLRGECSRGAACPFIHSDDVVPVCRDYIRGTCNRGDACPYHHLANFQATGAEPCRNFKKGECTRGASCPYVHIPEYVELCRDYQHGHCKRGLICPFHHGVSLSSPSSVKRRRDDEPERGRSSRYASADVSSLIEENRRLRAKLAGY